MNLDGARSFMYAHARLLERRVYETLFDGADAARVVQAVQAYQNADGGFGNGLEPDKRVPASQALDVEIAFQRLASAGAAAGDMVHAACDWLATIAEPSGAVPILMPSAADYPRAAHWSVVTFPAGLNPTAGIAAQANTMLIAHPWVDQATEYCLGELEAGRVEAEGHLLLGITKLLATIPDADRAARAASTVRAALEHASFFKLRADSDDYGVTPLDFAPTPTSFAASWFPADVIAGHLDALEQDQQPDGGWTIAWDPISEATRAEWRGIKTLQALTTLTAYER